MSDPFNTPFLRMKITPGDNGRGAVELRIQEEHISPGGTVHGGVYATVADNVMSAAISSVNPDRKAFVTIEMQVRFMRPVSTGSIRAESSLLKAGRKIMHTECKMFDDDGHLLATATGTYMMMEHPGPDVP